MKSLRDFLGLSLLLFLISPSQATIINVPADYDTIQAAIDVAIDGDTVLVQPGVYPDRISIEGKEIVLASTWILDGDTTAIDSTLIGPDEFQWDWTFLGLVSLVNGEGFGAELAGFTVRNGYWSGIRIDGGSPKIHHCIIQDNRFEHHDAGGAGAGIFCDSTSAEIYCNLIQNNTVGTNMGYAWGAGIGISGGAPEIHHNIISNNNAGYGVGSGWHGFGGGIGCINTEARIRDNQITCNHSSRSGGGIYIRESDAFISDNLISHNSGMNGAGINIFNECSPLLEGNTITHNYLPIIEHGSYGNCSGYGVYIDGATPIIGTEENPNNIYYNYGPTGREITFIDVEPTEIWCDTFTVSDPNYLTVLPESATVFINTPIIDNSDQATEIYVSPWGDNSHSGLSPDQAVQSVYFATLRVSSVETDSLEVHLAEGIYDSSSDQEFPVFTYEGLTISGPQNGYATLVSDTLNRTAIANINGTTSSLKNLDFVGGMYGLFIEGGYLKVSNSRIKNAETGIFLGEGIEGDSSGTVIDGCLIENHSTIGIYSSYPRNLSFNRTIFRGNSQAIYAQGGDMHITNCVFTNNDTTIYYRWSFSSTEVNIYNSILWNNFNNIPQDNDNLHISYSLVEEGYEGDGNIAGNPEFTDSLYYYLSENSPCIDAGNPDEVYNDIQDPNNPGYALFPSMGGLRNDIGLYGGPWDQLIPDLLPVKAQHTDSEIPVDYLVVDAWPNPFNSHFSLTVTVAEPGFLEIEMYNILGQKVKGIFNGRMVPGHMDFNCNLDGFSSGIYFIRAKTPAMEHIAKVLLAR